MPDIRDEGGALKEMPRGYLDLLRRVEPYLRNQSEDCLYLNIFSPVGKISFLFLSPMQSTMTMCMWAGGSIIDEDPKDRREER